MQNARREVKQMGKGRGETRSDGVAIDLDEEQGLDPAVVGRKAARLARLRREGFDVPSGIVLPTGWCSELDEEADEAAIRATVEAEVQGAVERLGEGPFAVRSSGVAEDGDVESMAGQFRTELDVPADEIADAVVRCVRAEAHHSRSDDDHAMAILIQPMVRARCAGVAFSRDPVTGDDIRIVSGVEGLGEDLVAGEATGEDWTVDNGEVAALDDAEVLTAEQVAEVVARLDEIEELFGEPQDIEWARDDDGLKILQARPITALPVPPPQEPVPEGTWIKDVTHYPNGMTPLGASVFLPALEHGMSEAFEKWGLIVETVNQHIHQHQVYGQMVPVGGKPGGSPPPAFLMGLLGRLVPAMRRRWKKAKQALEEDLGEKLIERWWAEDRDRMAEAARELREVDRPSLSDEELVDHFDEAVELLHVGERLHFLLFPPYVMPLRELAEFTEAELGWEVQKTLGLMAGLSDETSGPARGVSKLGAKARSSEEALELLQDDSVADDELAETLRAEVPEFGDAWDAFIDRWAHRTLGYEPGEPTLAERPGIIRRRVLEKADGDHNAAGPDLSAERERLADEAREHLDDASRTAKFDELLERAKKVWPVREDNIAFTDSMPNACIRYAGLEMGRRLTERALLRRPEDMAMLSRDELVESLLEGTDVRDLATRRHAERAWVAAHPTPPVLNGPDADPPDLKWMPEAIRKTSGALIWIFGLEYQTPKTPDDENVMTGQPAAPGRAKGTVRVIDGPEDFERVREGDIMVCSTTTPAWTVLFDALSGIIAEGGGLLAHSAIAAREHHIPAVLNVDDARERLKEGMVVEIDGTNGTIEVVS